jgi:hypothetical protein
MDKREDFEFILKTALGAFETNLHLSEERLIAYREGRLEEQEMERIRSHLEQCEACSTNFEALTAFLEPGYEVSAMEIDRSWKAFWQQIEGERKTKVRDTSKLKAFLQRFLPRVWRIRLVAVSLIFVIMAGAWVLVSQLRKEQARSERLEEENRRWQEKVNTLQRHHEALLAQLNQPEPTAAYELYPADKRAVSRPQGARIKIPQTVTKFTLSLFYLDRESAPPSYAIKIRDQSGQVVREIKGLTRQDQNWLHILVPRSLLREGEQYQLELFGQRGQNLVPVAEYVLIIE